MTQERINVCKIFILDNLKALAYNAIAARIQSEAKLEAVRAANKHLEEEYKNADFDGSGWGPRLEETKYFESEIKRYEVIESLHTDAYHAGTLYFALNPDDVVVKDTTLKNEAD